MKSTITRDRILRVITEELTRNNGVLPNSVVRELAADYAMSSRQIRRYQRVAAGLVAKPERVEDAPFGLLSVEEVEAMYLDANGCVRMLYNEMAELNAIDYSERTLHRRVEEFIPQAIRDIPTYGEKALHRGSVWGREATKIRNAIWEVDYFVVKAAVIPKGHHTYRTDYHIGLAVDRATYLITSAMVCEGAPTGNDGFAFVLGGTVPRAVRMDNEIITVGGKPDVVLVDNASDLTGRIVRTAFASVGIELETTHAYSGWEKGFVESLNRRIQEATTHRVPAQTSGPRTPRGESMFGDVPVLTQAGLSHLIVEVVDEWNAHRIEAWAESPLERWAAQDALRPLEIIEPEDLSRASLVAADPRKVTGKGISFNGLTYGAAELSAPRMRGKQVLIATYPGITEFIEVYFEGDWLCRATIRHLSTDAERATAQQHRQTLRDHSVRASARTEELRQVRAANANAAPDVFELITPASALVMTSDVAADGTLAPQSDSTSGAGSRLRDQSISGMSDADEVVANFLLKATGHSPAGAVAAATPPAKKASKPRTPNPSTAPAKKRGATTERRDGDGHDDERGAA